MDKFGVKFLNGKCEVYNCKSVFGVRFLARMYLSERKNNIDIMLCFVNGGIWKWKSGKWEEKRKCKENVRDDIDIVLGKLRERCCEFEGRQKKIIFD